MTTISILTCVLGEPQALRVTADSIKPYLSDRINWIIKFSDKSDKKFVESFAGKHINIYQKKDSSLYDALNQCLESCDGDYYIVLGAGDTILPDGMRVLLEMLNAGSMTGVSYHAPILFNSTGAISNPNPGALKHFMSCPHPSSLYKVKNSLAINGFDSSYRIAADYDHMSRYALTFGEGLLINSPPLVSFMGGGLSDIRALESHLEATLVRMRVWKTPDIRIYGDLLHETANTIANNIRHNFNG